MTLHMLMEVKARELEGRALLAFKAALSGNQVYLGRAQQILDGIRSGILPAGVCLEKSISAAKAQRLSAWVKSGNTLVCQDEESGLLSDSYECFLDVRSSAETVAMTDAVFCWGAHDTAAWQARYPHAEAKIHNTGSPRVDFWRPDFKPYFSTQVQGLKKRYGPYVLVASNFAFANGVVSPEEIIANAWKFGRVATEQEAQKLKGLIDDDVRMFRSFVELLRDLASRSLGVQFIVRPHPAERLEPWKDALLGCDNVHVVFEGGISGWVRGSLAVLHNGCTTALESYVGGIPALAYVPFASDRNMEIPNRLSICRSTINEIAEDILSLRAGNALTARTPENDSLVAERLANSTGELAAARIVKVINEISGRNFASVKWVRAKILDFELMLRRFVRQKLLRRSNKTDRKFPCLKKHEILEVRDRLALCDPSYQRCIVTHVYGDVFLIEAKEQRSA